MPILPGTDGVRKMSKSLGNYVGVTEPAAEIFGKLMSVPDDAMPLYWELLLGEDLDDEPPPERGEARLRAADLRSLRRRREAAASAEARFNQIHQDREIPADVAVHRIEIGATSTCRRCSARPSASAAARRARLLAQGGRRIDGEPVLRPSASMSRARSSPVACCRSASAASPGSRPPDRGRRTAGGQRTPRSL